MTKKQKLLIRWNGRVQKAISFYDNMKAINMLDRFVRNNLLCVKIKSKKG